MSTNLSKQKREDLLNKIEQIRLFLNQSLYDENARKLTGYLNELTTEINGQKYGLVFEEHKEGIDEILETNLPVLTEEKELFVNNGGELNFLIEGDNLASLQLLEKTHRGKIDVIYIDPPYNTGSDKFKYDDKIIDINDGFRHSKWISLMYKRLNYAKELLSNNGMIFISIDNNEIGSLKIICDEIFGENNFIGTIDWESKTKSQNTESAYQKLQPKCEYILCYGSEGTKHKFNLIKVGQKTYDFADEKGIYREHYLEVMNANGIRGRETMVFDISDGSAMISLPKGKQWQLGQDQVDLFKNRNDLFIRDGKVVIKMRPNDERIEKTLPFWAFFDKTIGTAESAKKELNTIIGDNHGFDTVKPTDLIQRLLFHSSNKSTTILDFFAGSGTTGHAVLKLNSEDGGHRKFILCTNNENSICRDITYQRLKTVITGKRKDGSIYSDGLPGSLKYFKVDFVEITENEYYEYADKLLLHVRELVELENAVNFEGNSKISIVLTEEELESFFTSHPDGVNTLYLGHDVLLSKEQKSLLKNSGIEVKIIPQYYYPELNG